LVLDCKLPKAEQTPCFPEHAQENRSVEHASSDTLQSSLYKHAWSQTWARQTKPWCEMMFYSPQVKSCL